MQKKIHIVGAGSMGCLFGAYLSKAEHEVCFIVREGNTPLSSSLPQGERGQEQITLTKDEEDFKHSVTFQTPTDSNDQIQNLIIATKAHDVKAALKSIEGRLAPQANILLLQNGMLVQEYVSNRYVDRAVYCGVSIEGVYRDAPMHVHHVGIGRTWIGSLQEPLSKEIALTGQNDFLNIFATCGLEFNVEPKIKQRLWAKLAINCAANALTAIYHCRNGDLLNKPDALDSMKTVCNEISSIMHAHNIPHEDLYPQAINALKTTAKNYSSMYQDIANHRQTEIAALNGFIVKQGKELGIPTPENQDLVTEILVML
jgi:2-dehydropantoate 2-reductase